MSAFDIAVVGMACRFPGAGNYHEYWQNLIGGRNCIREIPSDRWDWHRYYGDPRQEPNKTHVKWGGFIDDLDKFDPLFFGISPSEAAFIDPQHRLFLETAWHAVEDAGYSIASLAGRAIGVYAGVSKNDYSELMRETRHDIAPYISTGTVHSILVNRVSFLLNLRGRSEAVDTACSSSLVALHNAIRDIANGECEAAIVGGVNALITPTMFISHSKSGMLSPDGQCKTFSADANGYVRSEGVGVVFIKPLTKALSDGDHIHAVIKSSAINHGGRANFLTAPTTEAQAAVVRKALSRGEIDPRSITYIEAHGTGTPLGDPIEINGLKKAFDLKTPQPYCALSSAKTNVGHLESAAGMAGMIKVILAMKHRAIPAIRNFTQLNPYIELEQSPFYIAKENVSWERGEWPRRAGVSSFGMGGVNAHVVLEEAPETTREFAEQREFIVPLSAKRGRLKAYAESLLDHVEKHRSELALGDVAYTLQTGRDAFDERLTIAAHSLDELAAGLRRYIEDGEPLIRPSATFSPSDGEKVNARRIPLPTYPFARKRCWFTEKASAPRSGKTLKVSDFFIRDHVVQGKRMLPGVMHLELARAAGAAKVLKDVYWMTPVVVDQDVDIDVKLDAANFEIRQGETVHSRGIVADVAVPQGRVDVKTIQSRCVLTKNKAELYALFEENGLAYGSTFQVIERCVYNDRELLAELQLPDAARDAGGFVLHPAMMDGVFQAVTALSILGAHHAGQQYVPFHVDAVEVVHPTTDRCFVHATLETDGKWPSFDARLADRDGKLLVNIDSLQKRPIAEKVQIDYYRPEWRRHELPKQTAPSTRTLLVIANDEQVLEPFRRLRSGRVERVRRGGDYETVLHDLKPAEAVYVAGAESSIDDLLAFTQATFKARIHELNLVYVHPLEPLHAMAGGFARTLAYENPKFEFRSAGIDDADFETLARIACAELAISGLREVVYKDGRRHERRIVREAVPTDVASVLKPRGVYVISGGAGGLGNIFSRHLAQKYNATILWLGRSTQSDAITQKVQELERLGGRCAYFSVDITDADAVNRAIAQIRSTHGAIDGVIHAAGVIEDAFILRKQHESFARVIATKVRGALNLDAATQSEPLDFFLVFSSIAALMPNQGQSDYAAANSFLDRFVEARNERVVRGERAGASLAINWPLWANGGMRVTAEEERHLLRVFGMKPLATSDGIEIFETSLALVKSRFPELHQLIAIGGDRDKIEHCLGMDVVDEDAIAPAVQLDAEIKAIFAKRLGVPASTIDGNRSIAELGVSSISLMGVIRDLNQRFDADLKPTLLFDINTVDKLAAHLVEIGKDTIAIPEAPEWNRSLIDVAQSDPASLKFSRTFKVEEFYLRDHVVEGQYNMPGAAYIEMARQAGDLLWGDKATKRLLNNYWASQLSSPREDFTAHVHLAPKGDGYAYEIVSVTPAGEKRLHAMGQITREAGEQASSRIDVAQVTARCNEIQYPDKVYEQIRGEGLHVARTFEPMKQIFLNDTEALGQLVLPEEIKGTDGHYVLHPSLLTGVFQTALICNRRSMGNSRKYIPIGMDEIEVGGPIPAECWVYCEPRPGNARNEEMRKFDLEICGSDGIVVVRLKGFAIRALKEVAAPVRAAASAPALQSGTSAAVQELIKSKLAGPIGLEPAEIDVTTQFDQYGVTSVMVVELNEIFERMFGAIPKTLFFEYRNVAELAEYFIEQHGEKVAKLCSTDTPVRDAQTRASVPHLLRSLIAGPIGLPAEEIDITTQFDQYGVTSVMVVELNEIFERVFGPLPKTLFFEYRNIEELAGYFLEHHRDKLPAIGKPVEKPVEKPVQKPTQSTGDIAIVSAAGRFPGARNLREFWDVLSSGRDCITEIPDGRFNYRKHFDADPENNRIYSKWGGFIADVDRFDPTFFNISPRDAERIDPQERLLLEVVWEMLERAGYTRQRLLNVSDRRVGVFVGALWQPYESAGIEATASGNVVGPSSLLYSIANRISYFLDLAGPSMAIDTACSSSLTALHLACQSIRNGESRCAIVAGVNLSLSVSKYLFLSQNRFLSMDGRCRSYGAGGTGYVPGEGICALLVKPLANAIADGDSIMAVIKGSAINHGGRTNGYTVPNPKAQGNVIVDAIAQSGVDPATISYIDGHGTGTSLGDPIEIEGLEKALGKSGRTCAIGSVKSNIGHLEAAAGVASVIKVLLQMEHGQLAPTLHAETLNPNIDFERSIFRVQRELAPWTGTRRAGVSSFGAGGSNAHVILEQYEGPSLPPLRASGPATFVFSAKTDDRLVAVARQFHEFLHTADDADLHAIAYTLQLGREAMRERLTIVAASIAELRAALQEFIDGKPGKWQRGGEFVSSYERKYRFVPLPSYPFADERYWLERGADVSFAQSSLHPLLHRNTSDLTEQRYASTFTGNEFFLFDHRVRVDAETVQKILPGVAHLEVARAAVEQATPVRPEASVLELRNMVWANPIVVAAEKEIRIALMPIDDEQLDFEIYSQDGDVVTVHSQGRAVWSRVPAPAKLDLDAIRRRTEGRTLDSERVYEPCFRTGLVLGPAFQPVTSLRLGNDELLSSLRLPASVEADAMQYVLHPSMMDGALHGSIGLLDGWSEGSDKPRLPFALESLRVHAPCTREMVAWMRYAPGSRTKLHIDLCDLDGNVCVEIHGFTSRVLHKTTSALYATPVWIDAAPSSTEFAERHVVEAPQSGTIAERYTQLAIASFEKIQSILQHKPAGKVLVQIAIDDDRLAGVHGLLKTAELENPQITGEIVLNGVRRTLQWQEVAVTDDAPIAIKKDGVYLITGGRGALGSLFANEIRERGGKAIVAGRADVDLQNLADVERFIASLGHIDGILHCAGMIADSYILKKNTAQFAEVLAPKVTGTYNLDRATKDLGLDFFVFFSSITSAIGNPGQADYAAANGFMDAFAAERNRRGLRTRSINWPLWAAGRMGLDAATREALQQSTGMQPMQTATGLAAFHRALALPHDQLLVMEGDLAQMRRTLFNDDVGQAPSPVQAHPAATGEAPVLQEQTQDYLRKQLSGLLKLPAHRIDPNAAMEEYGIESILAMKLTNQLEKTFGSLPKTLFFEYQTIRDLSKYLIESHGAQLARLLGAPSSALRAPSPAAAGEGQRRLSRVSSRRADKADEPIAIIGLSGRYPQAKDLDAYWRVLSEGRDCIVEVPKERWDWREYFSEDRTKPGHHFSKWGGFIDGVDEFDALFFNISPLEAEQIDPQERLFLQHAWMAIEDAGYTRAGLQTPASNDQAGQVGVYAGVWCNEYQLFGAEASLLGKRQAFSVSIASIANRVSYALNLHGPSMAIDTMCSSSLTAMHIACQDLRAGRTTLAIAGGVNVNVHPNKYLMLSAAQAISSEGHCKSFGDGGDGYIPAEGVGVAVLKRLSDAERDGDHIYGIIRGSALNHGGKTNGYTVPNPQSQTGAIVRALSESRTDARNISYVETHGTGTRLGDPIEIAALTKAFNTTDTQFCPIGSAKSNIGHCESAAGIAGLTKVLLQMQHKQIVPSLHSTQLNPHIEFEKTPFVVNQTLRAWDSPRIAGISSFGAGGSNAHLIVEEYVQPERESVNGPCAIVLSARTNEQLRQKVSDLLEFVRTRTIDVAALAYTLQTGREAMDERLAFVVESTDELLQKLQDGSSWIQGRVKRDDDALSLFNNDADFQETIDKWLAKRKYAKLLELWVKGLDLDWSRLYADAKPRRISLPTYPFARERHWIDIPRSTQNGRDVRSPLLHPLLHENTSELSQQRYTSTFTGREFFLADHQVKGQKVLPGVAYLEMARAAVERAIPAWSGIELRNTVWSQPIIVGGETQIDIALTATGDDEVEYRISSDAGVHAQGRAARDRNEETTLDLERLDAQMTGGTLDASALYAACARMGLVYGPSFRTIQSIRRGNGQLLAKLRIDDKSAGYVLHPSVMDGALQACIALLEPGRAWMPFALASLRVHAPCTREMVAWVRAAQETFDIDLCDERGRVCVSMRGFAARAAGGPRPTTLVPVWERVQPQLGELPPGRVAVIGVDDVQDADHLIWILPPSDGRFIEAQEEGVLRGFRLIKSLNASRNLTWTIVTSDAGHGSVYGLAGSMAKEYPNWKVRILDGRAESLSHTEMLRLPFGELRYRDGQWYQRRLAECEIEGGNACGFKQHGVYVVIGGAGGVGEVLTEHLIAKYDSRVVWIGRREMDASIAKKLERIPAHYIAADARSTDDLQRACAEIKSRYGRIDGVIHSAIVLADKTLAQMPEEQFRAALSAKVDTSVRVAEVFGREPIDFIAYFSSIQSFVKAAGQSNYAAGCTFTDAFAEWQSANAPYAVKVINWGWWGSVGVVAGAEYQERMAELGIGSIEPQEGMAALERLLGSTQSQVVVIRTTKPEALALLQPGERVQLAASEAARVLETIEVRAGDMPANLDAELDRVLGRVLQAQIGTLASHVNPRWIEASRNALTNVHEQLDLQAALREWDRYKENGGPKARVRLVDATLRALPEILDGRRLATEVLFPNASMELVEAVYKDNPSADYFNETLATLAAEYVDARLKRDPNAKLRILEIGAGTGASSAALFRRLAGRDHCIEEYTYTDISRAFLLRAEQRYGSTLPYLKTALFDVEQPVWGEAVRAGSYDVVVACNVLHATRNIRQTVRNSKAALKRGGVLLLNELTANSLFMHLTFGLTEGWWRFEDPELRMPGSPVLSADGWADVLQSEGFGSVVFPARHAAELGQQIIAAESDGIIRIHVGQAPPPVPAQTRVSVLHKKPAQVSGPTIERHVRSLIRGTIAEALKMDESRIQDDRSFSEYGVDSIIGVNVVNRVSQQCGVTLPVTVIFDHNNVEQLTKYLAEEHREAVTATLQPAAEVVEVVEEVAPIVSRRGFGQRMADGGQPEKPLPAASPLSAVRTPLSETYRRAVVERPGTIAEVQWAEAAATPLAEGEVRIAVHAFSLNFGDLLCVKGLYPNMPPYPFTPGFEVSGTVVAVGEGVSRIAVGMEVLALTGDRMGGHATLVTVPESLVFRKPSSLSFEDASSLLTVGVTMMDAFRKAQLRRGEKILIQTAAGGTGLIAVQLALHAGAEIYATAGAPHKLDYLRRLGVQHVINYRERDFEQEIARLTGGNGVDVVINTLPGDAIQKGLNCLAPGGRYVEIAMTALKSAKTIDLSVLSDNQTFYSVDLIRLARKNPKLFGEYCEELLALVEQRVVRPTLSEVVTFPDIREAYERLENRDNIGKVVVAIPEEHRWRDAAATAPAASMQKEPIAIVGMSGRFGRTNSLDELWEALARGEDLTEEVTRWPLSGEEAKYCPRGGFLRGIDEFDPLFFRISGVEATYMDPQQRIFLEESWKALEDAGYAGSALEGRQCGVYVGCAAGDYPKLFKGKVPPQAFWGNAGSVIPARIAYYLDLQGPAVAVDTACSSSLVAIHLACQALRTGEVEMSIAGGVFVQCTADFHLTSGGAGMLSPTGRCHTFDEKADGFVPGEGVGVIVLKRLRDAIAAGDHIYGVVRGSGINQDGTTNGITAPSALSQERLERQVYEGFGIDASEIGMVEAHGTGTRLGDPVEYRALTRSFRKDTEKNHYCAIGSIKTNIGHTATAAGVAGVIKALLSLKHKQIPPSRNYVKGNPHIDFDNSPFYVNTSLKDWTDARRCAAVSSFGFSGTNSHIVLEEAPQVERRGSARPGYLIALSARTQEQLRTQVERLAAHLSQTGVSALHAGDISHTLLLGRKHWNHRLTCIVRDSAELLAALQRWLEKGSAPQVRVFQLQDDDRHEQESLKQYGVQCIEELRSSSDPVVHLEKLAAVAELFGQGYALPLQRLFTSDDRRVPLPAYPFARERYWVAGAEVARPHRTELDGNEFFLRDHLVRGEKWLPAVAYLELARAAVERSKPSATGVLELRDTVWSKPIVVERRTAVSVSLQDDHYEILSHDGEQELVHCEGRAVWSEETPGAIELEALAARMQRDVLSPETVYATCARMGLVYGPSFQSVTRIERGDGELLAQLRVPESADANGFVLHPSVMDGALQACVSLLDGESDQPRLPFALETLRVAAPCESEMFAWVRYAPGSHANDAVLKLDIDLCDVRGNVCVQLHGFASRILPVIHDEFDSDFYEKLIAGIVNHELSVEEAVELG